jgi:maltose alpha-D-glucosyltransferase/alpha-amylase
MKKQNWLKEAVFYEIYPQSFNDTNGDGIGDIRGIIDKLDYLESLGINAVWINPCFESPFIDAGYDVADYYKVAPRYGTNDTLKELFEKAEERGIRILLDLVPGHTSDKCEWFKESAKHAKTKYDDWYIWTDNTFGPTSEGDFVGGNSERNGQYMKNFFYCQPSLNFGFSNPDPKFPWQRSMNDPGPLAVRAEIKKIIKFWLDMGASGFRVDMAGSLVKKNGDKRGKDFQETQKFWQDIRVMLDKEYPEAILISEWFTPELSLPAGFHSDFTKEGPLYILRYHLGLGDEKALGYLTDIAFKETPDDLLDIFIEQANKAQKNAGYRHKHRKSNEHFDLVF